MRHRGAHLLALAALLAAAAALFAAVPARAHNTAELDVWQAEWTLSADTALTAALIAEWADMADRHRTHFYPPPPTTTRSRGGHMGNGTSDVTRWEPLVAAHFPASQVAKALCVIAGESGGNPTIDNQQGSSAAGLWQFLRTTWDRIAARRGGPTYAEGGPYDPILATDYAHDLWERSGWSQWNAAARC